MYTAAVLSHIKKKQIVQEFLTSKLQPHYLGKYTKILTKEKNWLPRAKKNDYDKYNYGTYFSKEFRKTH